MEIIELKANPGVVEDAKNKAYKSKKKYLKNEIEKEREKIKKLSIGIDRNMKVNTNGKIKIPVLKVPRFNGVRVDFTDEGWDFVVSFN